MSTDPSATSVVGGFFLRVLLWLVPLLAAWYWAREWLSLPVAWVAEQAMRGFFSYWVTGSELEGTTQTLLTALEVRAPDGRVGELAPTANILSYAYGTPFAAALLLAVDRQGWWWKLPLAGLALIPFQATSVCFTWLMQVAVLAAPETAAQTGFDAWDMNFFAAGYQLGFLLLPTLMPVLIWFALDRRVVAALLIESALERDD
ncbi:MAG: hypothetical protein KDH20_20125 [Rhodocyclaceae bacterium]|nr:hypothetical protein [Rhodocyclaceae bacterium]